MYLISQSRHMQEAAALRRDLAHAPFQRVQYLLAGSFDNAKLVSEGMHLQYVVKSNVAGRNIYAYAAAVYDCNIGIGLIAVRIGT